MTTIKKMRKFIKLMAWYPPYIGTGIRVAEVNGSATRYVIDMKLRWYNRNIYGSHFGGSLYAMCDPWFAFAASSYFGPEYIIWDKSASIDYLKPGKGKVRAIFEISNEELMSMKEKVDEVGRMDFTFHTYITGPGDVKVARVVKEIYIRRKASVAGDR